MVKSWTNVSAKEGLSACMTKTSELLALHQVLDGILSIYANWQRSDFRQSFGWREAVLSHRRHSCMHTIRNRHLSVCLIRRSQDSSNACHCSKQWPPLNANEDHLKGNVSHIAGLRFVSVFQSITHCSLTSPNVMYTALMHTQPSTDESLSSTTRDQRENRLAQILVRKLLRQSAALACAPEHLRTCILQPHILKTVLNFDWTSSYLFWSMLMN